MTSTTCLLARYRGLNDVLVRTDEIFPAPARLSSHLGVRQRSADIFPSPDPQLHLRLLDICLGH